MTGRKGEIGPAARGTERGHEGGELAAEGDGLETVGRQRRDRPRGRLVERRRRHGAWPDGRGRRHRGEQEDGQDHGQARLPGRSAGLAVYPGGVENQIVGGVTQILSRLLAEQYRYNRTNVTSGDFVSYPILRFKDAPKVTPIVVQRSTTTSAGGVGEPVAMASPPPRSRTRSSTRPACGCGRRRSRRPACGRR